MPLICQTCCSRYDMAETRKCRNCSNGMDEMETQLSSDYKVRKDYGDDPVKRYVVILQDVI